jgi:transposase
MNILKQAVGIDISKDTFMACVGYLESPQTIQFIKSGSFTNQKNQFNKFLRWVRSQLIHPSDPVWFVMEATGVYYESLAYFLREQGYSVAVVLPNAVKHYAQSLTVKSKTDDLDARMITQLALERALPAWTPPSEAIRKLRSLTREHLNLKELSTQVKNQLHAKECSYKPLAETAKRMKQQLAFFTKQITAIENEVRKLVDQNAELKEGVEYLDSIQGVGFMTAVGVLAETNGFALIRNTKQITSYAGLDVRLNQSGKKTGKTSISKHGNKHLRQLVYMPALAAIRFNEHLKTVYERLVVKKQNKKIALIAVARKLLCLMFTLWKKKDMYQPDYYKTRKVAAA